MITQLREAFKTMQVIKESKLSFLTVIQVLGTIE